MLLHLLKFPATAACQPVSTLHSNPTQIIKLRKLQWALDYYCDRVFLSGFSLFLNGGKISFKQPPVSTWQSSWPFVQRCEQNRRNTLLSVVKLSYSYDTWLGQDVKGHWIKKEQYSSWNKWTLANLCHVWFGHSLHCKDAKGKCHFPKNVRSPREFPAIRIYCSHCTARTT